MTKEAWQQKRIDDTAEWLFNALVKRQPNRSGLALTVDQAEAIAGQFVAGCLLLVNNIAIGRFVCSRALQTMQHWYPDSQTKCRDVMRYLAGNEIMFARMAGSKNEINKFFNSLEQGK